MGESRASAETEEGGAAAGEPPVLDAPRAPYVEDPGYQPYDGRNLSYAGTFRDPLKVWTIRTMEWLTGKWTLMRLVREYERTGRPPGVSFWGRCLELLDIELQTPEHEIRRIPSGGPVVVVANHPHGLVDGLILAELVGRVRRDFKILTRSLLTNVPEIQYHMLPVAFPHEPDSVRQNLRMRAEAMKHLAANGVIILFPAGRVATSETWWGPAVEPEWSPFTAKMILRSRAQVVPVHFPGQNSRAFQIADKLGDTFRQGLLLHEIKAAMHRPQRPVIGEPLGRAWIERWRDDPRGLMARLRALTLSLSPEGAGGAAGDQRVGTGVSPR